MSSRNPGKEVDFASNYPGSRVRFGPMEQEQRKMASSQTIAAADSFSCQAQPTSASSVTEMATVAEQLRRAREAQNLNVYQVAEITKIKTDHIRALESGT